MSGVWANAYLKLLPEVTGNTQIQLLTKSSTLSKFDRGTTGAE